MAKAGERYAGLTGNIWSYSKRNDVTGLKAALGRGVDVDLQNTAGWTPVHAAAAGNSLKALRILLRAGADLDLRDRGGNLAIHEAAKAGHLQALLLLKDAGSDLAEIRLSQTKGAAVRKLIVTATNVRDQQGADQSVGLASDAATVAGDGTAVPLAPAVGYNRKQAKSNAFFGPRKTPISGKLKKEILQRKRRAKHSESHRATPAPAGNAAATPAAAADGAPFLANRRLESTGHDASAHAAVPATTPPTTPPPPVPPVQPVRPSFGEAVQTAKQSRKQARKQARARRGNGDGADEAGVAGRDPPRLSRKAQLALDRAAALESGE